MPDPLDEPLLQALDDLLNEFQEMQRAIEKCVAPLIPLMYVKRYAGAESPCLRDREASAVHATRTNPAS